MTIFHVLKYPIRLDGAVKILLPEPILELWSARRTETYDEYYRLRIIDKYEAVDYFNNQSKFDIRYIKQKLLEYEGPI